MKTIYNIISILNIILFVISSEIVLAHQELKSSFERGKFEIFKSNNQMIVNFDIQSKIEGDFIFFIHVPSKMILSDNSNRDSSLNTKKNDYIKKEWKFKVPPDGHYFIEINIKINPAKREPGYQYFSNHVIYFEVKNKKIEKYQFDIDTNYYKKPIETNGNAKAIKLENINPKNNDKLQTTIITVQISGRIVFQDNEYIKGVPVMVWLDWDDDKEPSTAYTPYFWNDEDEYKHIGWDYADMDGNFSFYFSFESDVPANQIADYIRPYVSSNNYACTAYSGELLPYDEKYNIDITQSTTNVTANDLNIITSAGYGAAIRNISRAWMFNKEKFNSMLSSNLWYRIIDNGGDSKAYYTPMNVMMITFENMFPSASVCYHEFGHYSADVVDGVDKYCDGCSNHWFRKETNVCCAWNEGWAEFYSSACLDYWYSEENIDWIEKTGGEIETCKSQNGNFYQFLDYAQGYLCDNYDNTKVEGAIACFFYSLMDNYDLRHYNYSGDNDDITMLGPAFIRNNLDYAITYSWYHNIPYIQGLKEVILAQLDDYQLNEKTASINALYNSIINKQGKPRPATPTRIEIVGDINKRLIKWNDNTCPNSVSFDDYSGHPYYFDLLENNEDGFHVYRKPMSEQEQWNGTLNNYQLIHTANQDVTEYYDNDILQPGRYSYIVVAYNTGGNSIPGAQAVYDCSYSSQVYDLALSNHIADSYEYYGAQHNIENDVGTDFEIQTDADVIFCAGNEIRLGEGFKALNGSDFHAKIYSCDGCVKESGSPSPIIFTNVEIEKNNTYNNFNYYLSYNTPNPFSSTTEIVYSLPKPSPVIIEVYNSIGISLKRIVNKILQQSGEYKVIFNAANLPNGVYFYMLRTPEYSETKQMVIMR